MEEQSTKKEDETEKETHATEKVFESLEKIADINEEKVEKIEKKEENLEKKDDTLKVSEETVASEISIEKISSKTTIEEETNVKKRGKTSFKRRKITKYMCPICNQSDFGKKFLVCEECDNSRHIDCINPSLPEDFDIDKDKWYCDGDNNWLSCIKKREKKSVEETIEKVAEAEEVSAA